MKEYKNRIADKLLGYRLEEVGAVLIEGPKWCGKTTTAEQQAFETLCVRDLRVYADSVDGGVYHCRDKNGLECDAAFIFAMGLTAWWRLSWVGLMQ